MSTLRFHALQNVLDRAPNEIEPPSHKISDYFGENVFDTRSMREHLPEEAFKSVKRAMDEGARIDRSIADQVASSMKEWGIHKGATHYTHWFQPLTGSTAEKHDAFFDPVDEGRAIERFDGEQLVQQEPDASSLPSGGIRNTFEARGYTAWDPSSPAFVLGRTLCIPTIFISYTGESLDHKMPLLKANHAVEDAALPVCHYFDRKVSKVEPTLGWEQEYFLVDEALFNARPDMVMTGRALIGHDPAKGQQLNDHYFGAIPKRANAFMRDFETESLKLGIPVKTRHNEVAPNQFECAPVFEEANLANDHNQLLMILLESVARRHSFRVLFHEKPFLGLNGSGKHNNWSLATNTGKNLLSPGKNPKENLLFLTFFINTIKAIHDNADILRASIASAGNDHRLGANEAPPAILSVFIGEQLTRVLDDLEKQVKKKGKMTAEEKSYLKLNIGKIPRILMDNTDRNRTSPFAFTGNKFEFRAIGGSSNCASAMTALNSIVADQLNHFRGEVDQWIDKGHKKDEAVLKVLKEDVIRSRNIRFEGDNYSDEWVKEAHQRGLSELRDTPRALDVLLRKKTKELFERLNVFTERELEARKEIDLENYALKLQIESRVIGDISQNHIIPTALNYQNRLLENVKGMKEVFGGSSHTARTQQEILRKIDQHVHGVKTAVDNMLQERSKATELEGGRDRAIAYCDQVQPYFLEIKEHTDALEMLIDDELWPLPKAREILFTR